MRIRNILENKGNDVITIGPFESVRDTLALMLERNIAAVVLKDGPKIVGAVSERDVLRTVADHGAGGLNLPVGHIFNGRPISVSPEDTIKWVMGLMTHGRIRHLPVMDDGALVGIVSIGDIVKYRLEDLELESNVLRDMAVAAR